jgi:hypothetical protein
MKRKIPETEEKSGFGYFCAGRQEYSLFFAKAFLLSRDKIIYSLRGVLFIL